MSEWEIVSLGPTYDDLARYRAEVHRGIVHTDEWRAKMADLQSHWDAEQRAKLIADGYEQVNGKVWIGPSKPSRRRWWRR